MVTQLPLTFVTADMVCSVMCAYDDNTLAPIPPTLAPGEKEHVVVYQDESIFHTNEYRRRQWLLSDQQALKKKGNGHAIHVSDFICEPSGRLALSDTQVIEQNKLPVDSSARLKSFNACTIIYPGKNNDGWWTLPQLMKQTSSAIDIFELLHPNKVGIWVFDCSSAHEGLAPDALNINNMNINPGGKQGLLQNTAIPLSPTLLPSPASQIHEAKHKKWYIHQTTQMSCCAGNPKVSRLFSRNGSQYGMNL